MARLRFSPSATSQTNYIMELLSKLAMSEYEQEQKKSLQKDQLDMYSKLYDKQLAAIGGGQRGFGGAGTSEFGMVNQPYSDLINRGEGGLFGKDFAINPLMPETTTSSMTQPMTQKSITIGGMKGVPRSTFVAPPAQKETTQAIVDEKGNIIGTRPKGSVFQPRGKEDKYKDLFTDEKTGKQKSPFAEYPDAFQEDGVWKVIRNNKKYRIE